MARRGFLLVPVLAAPLMLVAPDMRVAATMAPAAKALPVPDSVSTVAWSTELDEQVRDIVPAGTGVVVLVDDGVVAIDGRTGAVRWTRRRHGAVAEQVDASPDGATVLVQYRPRDRFHLRREIIEAVTGQLRYVVDDVAEGAGDRTLAPMTNTVYIGANEDEAEFYGYSLTDHSRLWTYAAPDDCRIMPDHSSRFAIATGLLLPVSCPAHDPTELETAGIAITEPANDEYQLISLPTGEPVPSTKAARSCLSANFGVSLTSGAVCVDPALETIEGLVHNGRINLAAGTFTDENLHLIPVTLGSSRLDHDLIRFVAAPGAVVVTTERSATDDDPVRLVGLR